MYNGSAEMKNLFFKDGTFYFACGYEDNDLARRAGFSFDKQTQMWATTFAQVAAQVASTPEERELVAGAIVEARRDILASSNTYSDFAPVVPSGEELMPFQRAGVERLTKRRANLLADDMGLGKTAQAVAYANMIHPSFVLVICPASLKINWLREWRRWTTLSHEAKIASSTNFPNSPVVIINYDIVARNIEEITSRPWDLLILDECHMLKNLKAQRTKAIFGHRGKRGIWAPYKLALTGTPIVNRPIELFSTLRYLDPLGWPSQFDYARRYCAAKRTRFGWDMSGSSRMDELQNRLRSTVMTRRTKDEVLPQLPDKVRQVLEFDADRGVKTALKKEQDWLSAALTQLGAKDPENLTAEEYREVVQLMKGGLRVAFEEMATVRREMAESKIPMIIEHLHDVLDADKKVVVFCHHIEVAKQLSEEFGKVAVTLTGSTLPPARQRAVDSFQNDPKVRLFIGNIRAAGVGLTLTAASHVVFAEMDWTPGNMTQAEDRCHRIGQKDSVLIQYLVLTGSLDAAMAKTLVSKSRVIERAVDLDSNIKEMLK